MVIFCSVLWRDKSRSGQFDDLKLWENEAMDKGSGILMKLLGLLLLAVALLANSAVAADWEAKAPDFETILQKLAKNRNLQINSFFSSTNYQLQQPFKGGLS